MANGQIKAVRNASNNQVNSCAGQGICPDKKQEILGNSTKSIADLGKLRINGAKNKKGK